MYTNVASLFMLCVIASLYQHAILTDVKATEFSQIKNLRCTGVSPLKTYSQISLARCGIRCSSNTGCEIMNYDHNLRTCHLLGTSPFDQSLWSTFDHNDSWSTYFFKSPPGHKLTGINATSSSFIENIAGAYRANDGVLSTSYDKPPHCAHTNLSTDNFWQMEFEMPVPVTAVDIYFRAECCYERNVNIWLYVCQTEAECAGNPGMLCAFYGGPPSDPSQPQRITCDKVGNGRFLRLRQVTPPPGNYLTLCEVIAYS